MGLVYSRVVDKSHCGASVANIKVTDLFSYGAVLLAELLEVVVMALKAGCGGKATGTSVSWAMTKIHSFRA